MLIRSCVCFTLKSEKCKYIFTCKGDMVYLAEEKGIRR